MTVVRAPRDQAMREHAERRRPLADEELARIRSALEPSATAIVATPLLGGLDRATYRLDVGRADGATRRLVLRGTRAGAPDPKELVADEFATLSVVARLTPLAPRPLFLDREGSLIGAPSFVMTHFDGDPAPPGDDPHAWLAELATALASVHAVPLGIATDGLERKGDPVHRAEWMRARLEIDDPLSQEIVAAVGRAAPRVRGNGDVLVHGDFWYGNSVWRDGRIVGLVDWFSAGVADPAGDVASARIDAALVLGLDAADELMGLYTARRGPLADIAFWDALLCLAGLKFLRGWVAAYAEVGFAISESEARPRLERFARRALGALR